MSCIRSSNFIAGAQLAVIVEALGRKLAQHAGHARMGVLNVVHRVFVGFRGGQVQVEHGLHRVEVGVLIEARGPVIEPDAGFGAL